jgi:hypothetical protein
MIVEVSTMVVGMTVVRQDVSTTVVVSFGKVVVM